MILHLNVRDNSDSIFANMMLVMHTRAASQKAL